MNPATPQLPEHGLPAVEILPKSERGRYRDLHTLDDVKRHMARACRMLERGKLGHEQGRAIVYGLKSLATLMQEMDTERRLAEMEQQLANLKALRSQPLRRETVAR